jgi:hypothetical protein
LLAALGGADADGGATTSTAGALLLVLFAWASACGGAWRQPLSKHSAHSTRNRRSSVDITVRHAIAPSWTAHDNRASLCMEKPLRNGYMLDALDCSGRVCTPMIRQPLALATTLILFGCGSSNSDGGAGGATTAGAGKGGEPTTSGGAASGGATNAGAANAGAPGIGGTGGGGGAIAAGGAVSGESADLPSLDPTADTRKLSEGDKGVLCDWVNDKLGGYGAMFECSPGMTVMNDPTQAICVTYFLNFGCEVTVQDVTACTLARVPSHACNAEFDTCHQLFCQ